MGGSRQPLISVSCILIILGAAAAAATATSVHGYGELAGLIGAAATRVIGPMEGARWAAGVFDDDWPAGQATALDDLYLYPEDLRAAGPSAGPAPGRAARPGAAGDLTADFLGLAPDLGRMSPNSHGRLERPGAQRPGPPCPDLAVARMSVSQLMQMFPPFSELPRLADPARTLAAHP